MSQALTNISWLIAEKIASMMLVLLLNIFIARALGPEQFGILNFIVAFFAILSPLSAVGLNAIITRELVQPQHSAKVIMSTVLCFRLFGGFLALLFAGIAVKFNILTNVASYSWALLLFALVNVFNALHVIDFWFQAKVKAKQVVKARFLVVLCFSMVKFWLIIFDASVNTFLIVVAGEYLCISLSFLIAFYLDKGRFLFSAIKFSYGFMLLKESYWLIFSGIASIVYLKIDQLMLGEMISVTEVGVYAVASKISEVWYFFAIALVSSYFPALLKAKSNNNGLYTRKLQKLNDVLFFTALCLAIIFFFVAEFVIVFLFGEAYRASGQILVIHIWAGVFVFMRALLSKWLIAEKLVRFSLLTNGVGAIINVVLNLYLIPIYGGLGAAIATVISYAFASFFVLFFSKKTIPIAIIMTKSLVSPFRIMLDKVKFQR